jgi:hypothetical protein
MAAVPGELIVRRLAGRGTTYDLDKGATKLIFKMLAFGESR